MAKKDKKEKVTKLEVNPKEETIPTGDAQDFIIGNNPQPVEPEVPVNFVGAHSNEDNTELKDPEFHDKEDEVKPIEPDAAEEEASTPPERRYHKQDIVHIAQVVYEAQRAFAITNGDNSYKGWDEESDQQKDELISYVETILVENIPVVHETKIVVLTHAIINALK